MSHDRIALLVRAVARLRVDGSSDGELVDALARLILPAPEAAPVFAATIRTAAPDVTAGPRAEARESAVSRPTYASDEGAAPPVEKTKKSRAKLTLVKAVPSLLEQVIDRADLDVPQTPVVGGVRGNERALAESQLAPPLESLFATGRVRAIIRELATRVTPSGALDVNATVARIARGQAIERLPRRPLSALGHTVQLLFDGGPLMVPFARDKQQLLATAGRVLGRDRLRVADFIGTPLQGVRAQRQVRWDAFRWPESRSAVVVVSDLGAGAAGVETDRHTLEWLRFLDEAHARGLRTFALVPYPPDRWPRAAAAFSTTLTWDVETGVQVLRRGRER